MTACQSLRLLSVCCAAETATLGGTPPPELQLNLAARGELPSMRTASPQGFRRKPPLAAPATPDDKTFTSPHNSPLRAPLDLANTAASSGLGLSSPTEASFIGLGSPHVSNKGSGVGNGLPRGLPRHLSMDVASMRHLGISHAESASAQRLLPRHRQSSLGSAGVPIITEEVHPRL